MSYVLDFTAESIPTQEMLAPAVQERITKKSVNCLKILPKLILYYYRLIWQFYLREEWGTIGVFMLLMMT